LSPSALAPPLPAPAGLGDISTAEALELAAEIESYWYRKDDTSYDPYDGLLARVPHALTATRAGRLALVHLHRRFPHNLRPLFGVPPTKSPYTVALFASAGVRIADATGSRAARDAVRKRLAWLRATSVRGGWAYPFDVQTRTFHYRKTTPNVVCTAFAARAFLDAAERTGDEEALEVAGAAARFATRELLEQRAGKCWFRYLPAEDDLIHNGNVLAAELVVRYGSLTRDPRLVELGLDALDVTLEAIRPDGSLLYGRGPHLAWVDGHHTGFVIESLHTIAGCHPLVAPGLHTTVDRMTRFYRARLFGPDGSAYQRPDTRYPLDSIAAAQGIQTFAKLGGPYRATAERIAAWVLTALSMPSGRFAYVRGRRHIKRVPYVRWTEAPLCLAFAVLGTEPASTP